MAAAVSRYELGDGTTMAPASLPEGRRHLIGVIWVDAGVNPNMHEYTWNPNEWWINRA
jgi:hypothetical protein